MAGTYLPSTPTDVIVQPICLSTYMYLGPCLHSHGMYCNDPTVCCQAAYDKICTAKKQAEERTRKLDDKRKKIKLGKRLLSKQQNKIYTMTILHKMMVNDGERLSEPKQTSY